MNASKKRLVSIFALAAGLLALALPAAAETGSYGYFRVVEGSATLMQAGTDERSSAEINQPVLGGDRIWVPDRSRVELVLADRNILRLDGGSELVLERLAASPDRDDRATVLRLLEGNLQLVVTEDSLGDELPRIETPNATIYPTSFGVYRVTAAREGWSEVVVRRGTAEVVTDRGSHRVRADEEAIIDGGDRYAGVEVREAGGFDTLERWGRQLDDDYASADLRYVDDNLRYAAAPLARYGSWVTVDGSPYWRPRVAAGWSPYWQGRWAYTPIGLTWISQEPWGWVPYHYGSWDYLPAYGWVWQPGYVFSPAWVYWYWGPSYVGWCPTGYYTRYYGPRFGGGFGFRYGVYGWAGGDWGHFHHWNFVHSRYFDHRGGHGHHDGFWDGRRDVRRYAVQIDSAPGRGPSLERGVITTDTKPLRPSTWTKPGEAWRALQATRNGPGAAELPDVTSFIARKPDLPANVARVVRAEGNTNALDGTPLKPSTLGRGNARRAEAGAARPGSDSGWSNRVGSQPTVTLGDDGPRGTSRQPTSQTKPMARPGSSSAQAQDGSGGSADADGRRRLVIENPNKPGASEPAARGSQPVVRERPGRPAPESDGGAPRPRRVEIDSSPGPSSAEAPAARGRSARPAPDADGGAPRPDRSYQKPLETRPPADRDDRRYDLPREDRDGDARSRSSERYRLPDRSEGAKPYRPDDRYKQPEPRVIEPTYRGPEPSRRPDPPRYESGSDSRPPPRVESKPGASESRERQAQPQRSRERSSSSSQGRERQARPRDDGGKDRQ